MRTTGKPRPLTSATLRYMDEFIGMRCSMDMLSISLFPNMKEVTESFGAYDAIRRHGKLDTKDESVSVVALGDGRTPRTAATFAFRTSWQCYSLDPALKNERWSHVVRQLTALPRRGEDEDLHLPGAVAIVAVHSHAPLLECVNRIHTPAGAPRIVVAMPCCVKQYLEREPDITYEDLGVWSPKRTMKIWRTAA